MSLEIPIYRLLEKEAHCQFNDMRHAQKHFQVIELSAAGALIDCSLHFPSHHYLDIQINWNTQQSLSLFTCVSRSGSERLKLRFIHFDSSERDRVIQTLSALCPAEWIIGKAKLPEIKKQPVIKKLGSKKLNEEKKPQDKLDKKYESLLRNILTHHVSTPELEIELRGMIQAVVSMNHEGERSGQKQDDLVELLERKVSRLVSSLDLAEGKIARLSQEQKHSRQMDRHIPQEITHSDPAHETKKALLKALIEENLDLRAQITK